MATHGEPRVQPVTRIELSSALLGFWRIKTDSFDGQKQRRVPQTNQECVGADDPLVGTVVYKYQVSKETAVEATLILKTQGFDVRNAASL
jgi:hypothetical protein